jgi:hypothetical protein
MKSKSCAALHALLAVAFASGSSVAQNPDAPEQQTLRPAMVFYG